MSEGPAKLVLATPKPIQLQNKPMHASALWAKPKLQLPRERWGIMSMFGEAMAKLQLYEQSSSCNHTTSKTPYCLGFAHHAYYCYAPQT
jgi:hypothetical protein